MKLEHDCSDCLHAFESTEIVHGMVMREMRCEFERADFPHAKHCPTCVAEIIDTREEAGE